MGWLGCHDHTIEKAGRMSEKAASQQGPVTVAVSRRVVPGREDEFAEWVRGISEDAARFPGHLGAGHIRPAEPGGEHTIVYRFDTKEHFDQWQDSEARSRWVRRSRELITGEPRIQTATGLEYWFQDPASPAGVSPPVWKQALLTWLGLYPTALLIAYTIGVLIAGWSLPLRAVVTSAVTIVLMTWVVMPLVTRAFRRFLHQEKTER